MKLEPTSPVQLATVLEALIHGPTHWAYADAKEMAEEFVKEVREMRMEATRNDVRAYCASAATIAEETGEDYSAVLARMNID